MVWHLDSRISLSLLRLPWGSYPKHVLPIQGSGCSLGRVDYFLLRVSLLNQNVGCWRFFLHLPISQLLCCKLFIICLISRVSRCKNIVLCKNVLMFDAYNLHVSACGWTCVYVILLHVFVRFCVWEFILLRNRPWSEDLSLCTSRNVMKRLLCLIANNIATQQVSLFNGEQY